MDKMLTALRARLIDDWRSAWRFWSLRLQSMGLALLALAEPLSQALAQLPEDVRASVPLLQWLAMILVGGGMLARLIKQGKPNA
jgi:hypothetical protein